MDLLTFSTAARLLGIHRQTLEYYQQRGVLKYDVMLGNKHYFKRQTLEVFKAGIDSLMSLDEIAQKYHLTWEQVYQAMRQKHQVEPTERLGRALLFADFCSSQLLR